MAIVRNRSAHWFDITGGGWIIADGEANIDISHAHEQEAISRGVLIVVDPNVQPPPTPGPWSWPPAFHPYDPNYPGHTWDYYLDRPPEPEDLSQMDDQLYALTRKVETTIVARNILAPARAATTASITLSGLQTIDGVALASGDRVLVKNQSTASQNGVYVATNSVWTRSTDADTSAELYAGLVIFVSEGATNASSGFVMSTTGTITIGTTPISWTQFTGAASISAGAGLTKTGNTFDVGAGSGILVAADSISVDTTVVPVIGTVPLLLPAADTRNAFSGSSGRVLFAGSVTGDSQARFTIDTGGALKWGPGNAATDVTLYRNSVDRLQTDDTFAIRRTVVGDSALATFITGDGQFRLLVQANGSLYWSDGTAAADTTLARSAAARLALTGMLTTTLGVATRTKAGTPVDGDWTVAPPDGALVVDTSAQKLWMRAGGAWVASAAAGGGGGGASVAKITALGGD